MRQGYCYTCLAIGGYFGRVTITKFRVHTKGVMQQHATLRRVLRRFFKGRCFLEGFFLRRLL